MCFKLEKAKRWSDTPLPVFEGLTGGRWNMIVSSDSSRSVVLNLEPPDVLGLQLPEILASRGSGEGFWEL